MIRVVVVDDHALFRQGVVTALGDHVDVVGEADDVESGIAVIRRTVPDVVLLDVHLTSGSGAEIILAVRDGLPGVSFLALSVSDAPSDVLGLVRAGARGYVTKRIDGAELVESIEQVAVGNAVFSPRLAGFVLDAFTARPAPTGSDPTADARSPEPTEPTDRTDPAPDRTAPDPDLPADYERLTAREREVMQHLARGYAYKEIAAELFISVRTVESHASAVLRKLQLSSRHELTHWAARNRLV